VDVGTVRVEGYYEVLALHRYLFECKGEDLSSEYAGSPFIAAIQNRLADALEAADPGSGWTTWRAAEGHQQRIDAVRQHLLSAAGQWNGMSREQRQAYVQDLLAPLRTPDDLLAELVDVQASPVPTRSTDSPAKDH
jgi:acyl-CoA reductase-like NAD-dependent aldehyde dehydrogenase